MIKFEEYETPLQEISEGRIKDIIESQQIALYSLATNHACAFPAFPSQDEILFLARFYRDTKGVKDEKNSKQY